MELYLIKIKIKIKYFKILIKLIYCFKMIKQEICKSYSIKKKKLPKISQICQ